MQLDIFADSRDVMLRNDVLRAVQRYDAQSASQALAAFAQEYPDDRDRSLLGLLVNSLLRRSSEPFIDHGDVFLAHRWLSTEVHPAATRGLGNRHGQKWIGLLWAELAKRTVGLSFRAELSDAHCVPLYLLANHWVEAQAAVTTIESWRRIPSPLMWMTETCFRLDGLDAAWPMIAELAWLSPTRFDALLRRLDDRVLNSLRAAFDLSFGALSENNDVADLAWFPAWLLTHKSGLASFLRQCEPSREGAPERATRLMLRLLLLEREGRHHELLESRRHLQSLHGGLYTLYMRTR